METGSVLIWCVCFSNSNLKRPCGCVNREGNPSGTFIDEDLFPSPSVHHSMLFSFRLHMCKDEPFHTTPTLVLPMKPMHSRCPSSCLNRYPGCLRLSPQNGGQTDLGTTSGFSSVDERGFISCRLGENHSIWVHSPILYTTISVRFCNSRIKKGESQVKKCHTRTMMYSESDKSFKMNTHHLPFKSDRWAELLILLHQNKKRWGSRGKIVTLELNSMMYSEADKGFKNKLTSCVPWKGMKGRVDKSMGIVTLIPEGLVKINLTESFRFVKSTSCRKWNWSDSCRPVERWLGHSYLRRVDDNDVSLFWSHCSKHRQTEEIQLNTSFVSLRFLCVYFQPNTKRWGGREVIMNR